MSVAGKGGGHTALEDIKGGAVGDWLVVGWFTPDYRPLAETFASIMVAASSRVIVFRPTEQARAFAQEWERICESLSGKIHYSGDETALMWAYLRRPDAAFSYIDRRYSGAEIGNRLSADVVICHDSAHEKQAPIMVGLKSALKAIERRLIRTGRTKRSKAACEMSIVMNGNG